MTIDWEFFIRLSFGFSMNNGRPIQRSGDPASLANNELFNDKHVHDMAITTGYAFAILNQDVKNRTVVISDDTRNMLDCKIVEILSTNTIKDIEDVLNSYKETIFEKFFKYDGIVLTRK